MLKPMVVVAALVLGSFQLADAQEPYPVAVGLGAGLQGGLGEGYYHGMVHVTVTPPRWPVALRLDGVAGREGHHVSAMTTALSASTVVTLRPWRIAPYLIVGHTRVHIPAYSVTYAGQAMVRPAREDTDLSGGLGLRTRVRSGEIFGEMRSLGQLGAALTMGFTF